MLESSSNSVGLVMDFLRREITEDRTDQLLDEVMKRLPLPWFLPKSIVRGVMDRFLPEQLLNAIESVLVKKFM